MRPSRLAFIAEELTPPADEGIKNTANQLAASFHRCFSDLTVFSRYGGRTERFEVLPLPQNRLLLGIEFIKKLRKASPEAIVYLPGSSGTLGAFVRAAIIKMSSGGVKTTLINLQSRQYSPLLKLLHLPKIVDSVFAQSVKNVADLKALGFNVSWIPGGVDVEKFTSVEAKEKERLRLKYGIPLNAKVLLHVGHLNALRNIAVFEQLALEGYKVILVVSKSTDQDVELMKRLKKAGIEFCLDFVEQIQQYYQLADCYIFPVCNECSAVDAPLSVMEAMACNLPVITTRFGALPQMFEPHNGLYFYDEMNDSLSDLVKKALCIRECRTREMVIPYTWDSLSGRILDVLFPDQFPQAVVSDHLLFREERALQ